MGKNTQNVRFNFGFLNNTQDSTNLKDHEATTANALDPDKLAIGTLAISDLATPAPTPKDLTTATLNKRLFSIALGFNELQFEEDSVNHNGIFRIVSDDLYPQLGGHVSLASVDSSAVFSPLSGALTLDTARIIAGFSFTGSSSDNYVIEIVDPVTPTYKLLINNSLKTIGNPLNIGTFTQLTNGQNVEVQVNGAYVPVAGHQATFTVTKQTLPEDGKYFYKLVYVKNDTAQIKPSENIQGRPTIKPDSFEIKNFDETGAQVSSNIIQITLPASIPAYTDEVWCYRKSPNSDTYVRICVYTLSSNTISFDNGNPSITGKVFTDDGLTSSISNLVVLNSINDESIGSIRQSIGATNLSVNSLFEKDGRLWIQFSDRKDVLFYSRLGDWWGWNRANSFGFDSDITNIESLRDPTVVGGKFTTVVTTTNGIFHITGDGTELNPYQRVRAIQDINIEENSLLNLNGILMFMTKSSDGQYNSGNYGQKIYQYDLQQLTEVSAVIRNSAVITSTDIVLGTSLKGSDKYVIGKNNSPFLSVYHKDAKAWIETSATMESTAWVWQSKNFTSSFLQDFKLVSARFFKVDFIGSIGITFGIINDTDASVSTTTFNLLNASRGQIIQRMPNIKGRKWYFQISGLPTAELYNFYFVV